MEQPRIQGTGPFSRRRFGAAVSALRRFGANVLALIHFLPRSFSAYTLVPYVLAPKVLAPEAFAPFYLLSHS